MWERMRRDLDAAVERDPAARTRWEVALLYPGVHALWAHRASHWMWRRGACFPARSLSQLARFATGIEIHPGATIGEGVFIDHGAGIVVGETTEIGDDVTIYQGVTLGGTTLDPGKRHPTIGDRVVVGAGAKVLGPLTVGSDSRVGANAVLVRSVPDRSVVVGVPGQVISSGGVSTGTTPTSDPLGASVHSLLTRVDRLEEELSGHVEDQPSHLRADGTWELHDFAI